MAFRIKQYGELSGWRPIPMDMPLVQQTHCPCDGVELQTACNLIGDDVTVRVGMCPQCGYLGYIDRPTREWFEQFYNSDWDGQGQNDTEATAEVIRRDYRKHDTLTELVKQSGVGKDEWILEIGAGYGCVMQQLKEAGYANVFGVEPSKHRADLIKRVFGLSVYSGPFPLPPELNAVEWRHVRYGLVYSSHVLEHCYNPAEMIESMSELQDRGGLLSIVVPRQQTEPTMGVLLFLPHLHSFTEASLVNLVGAQGYEVLSLQRDAQSIYVSAIKTNRKASLPQAVCDGIKKLQDGLAGTCKAERSSRFWWNSLNDGSGYVPDGDDWATFAQYIKRPRYACVEPCERKTDAPCEVQFEGNLRLCVK